MFKKKFTSGNIALILILSLIAFGFTPQGTTTIRKYIGMMVNAGITQDDLVGLKGGTNGGKWFVDAGLSAAGTGEFAGKTWALAYKTIFAAYTAASAGDIIYVAPGTYTDTLRVLKDRITILAATAIHNGKVRSSVIWSELSGSNVSHLIVGADHFTISGFTFTSDTTVSTVQLGNLVAAIGSANYTKILNCYFTSSDNSTTIGIQMEPDSVDFALIDGCAFVGHATSGIELIGDECVIQNSYFKILSGNSGINLTSTTGSNVGSYIYKNKFLGVNSSDLGILITNSPSEGTFIITNNLFAYLSSAITQDKGSEEAFIQNYVGAADGDTLYDPSS